MQTIDTFQVEATNVRCNGRYIATNQIGTKTVELYLFNGEYYVIWYRRSLNFTALYKVEKISLQTAMMIFDNISW